MYILFYCLISKQFRNYEDFEYSNINVPTAKRCHIKNNLAITSIGCGAIIFKKKLLLFLCYIHSFHMSLVWLSL